jgi:N-acetyl-alpha-D-glucosaminyl L-malate synthase BshA
MDRSYLPITRYAIQQSDGVTSISDYLKTVTEANFNTTRPIEVVHNFVNCDVYKPITDADARAKARARLAAPDEFLFMHLSNFRPVKRVADVVQIFAQVAKQLPARLALVGDGPDRSTAEWLAHSLGIHDHIHFLGKQDRVNELLPLADLMLMPSEMESFGLAALEAMACQTPAIATRVGGVPELIDDGINGLLFSIGDVDGMARASVDLLKDTDRHQAMRIAARKTAQDRFCSTRILPRYVAFYESLLNTAEV